MPSDMKERIAREFAELARTKSIDKITVKDIVEQCHITRQTFYYHFRDIYDLVGWVISSDIIRIISGRKTQDTWQEGFLSIFQEVERNHVFVLLSYGSPDSSVGRAED